MEKLGDYCEMEVPIDIIECRICQEEDFMIKMEVPCACLGSLKYAHRACVQKCAVNWDVPGGGARGMVPMPPRNEAREALLVIDDSNDEEGRAKAACGKGTIICCGIYIVLLGLELAGLMYFNSKMEPRPLTNPVWAPFAMWIENSHRHANANANAKNLFIIKREDPTAHIDEDEEKHVHLIA
ncbi:hypothetical protein L484_013605 [Morus notabilis]|uniref:RING-CH-type domain-containing protein n=1 Tax=Morus notabilis TaxID=981085 RepID=W9QF83_9ROSA|nr:hypothetical protein L484_013605 [Morus notabilis]